MEMQQVTTKVRVSRFSGIIQTKITQVTLNTLAKTSPEHKRKKHIAPEKKRKCKLTLTLSILLTHLEFAATAARKTRF